MKIRKFNKKAEKWGYEGRLFYDIDKHIVIPEPMFSKKFTFDDSFWHNFVLGFRNQYLESLFNQIINETLSTRVKKPFISRLAHFVYFWFNY
jgi:hypothetical protein